MGKRGKGTGGRWLMGDIAPMWRRALEAERHSPHTITSYANALAKWRAWRAEAGLSDRLGDVTPDELRQWMLAMQARYAAWSVTTWTAGVKRFFAWCVAEDLLTVSPAATITPPSAEEPEARVLDDAELAALFKVCTGPGFFDRRDQALMRMLLDTGLRVAELCRMQIADVDLREKVARVPRGKGGAWRYCPYGAKAAKALDRYLLARGGYLEERGWTHTAVWLGQRGPFSDAGVQLMLIQRSAQAGIAPIHPHLFRHTFIDRMLRVDIHEQHIRAITGHRTSKVFERYAKKLRSERAIDEYQGHAPGDKL